LDREEVYDDRPGAAGHPERGGLDPSPVAEYLELSTNYLARLERGEYPISERTARDVDVLYMVYKLALALGLIET
jgi:hypothetical protein